jgi:NAD(P)H-dependent flavin oxidoreductase YrpB (nitropropane dioxygenase family)
VIDEIHESGRWSPRCAARPAGHPPQANAGVDIVIAQGTEGGGHTGEIASMVLWPEVIDAIGDTPMLAAGGIGSGRQMAAALALGAQGVWTGSLWLTVEEADVPPAQMKSALEATSRDTVRSRIVDRQAVPHAAQRLDRGLGGPGNPKPLGMPMQFMVTSKRCSAATSTPSRPETCSSTRSARSSAA